MLSHPNPSHHPHLLPQKCPPLPLTHIYSLMLELRSFHLFDYNTFWQLKRQILMIKV